MSFKTVVIREKTWLASEVRKEGLTIVSEVPGELIGATLQTKEFPGLLQVVDSNLANVLLELHCAKCRAKDETILIEAKRHAGLSAFLQGEGSTAVIFHQSFDVGQGIYKIQQILEKAYEPQWVQGYQFNLDTAATNKLIDQFPTAPNYIYVQTCSGTVTMSFNSQNEPPWTLTVKDQFRMPFEQLYLTWTAQSTKRLTIYISNKEIFRSTLA